MREVEGNQTKLLPDHEGRDYAIVPFDWRVRCMVFALMLSIKSPLVTPGCLLCLHCLRCLHYLMNIPLQYGTYLQLARHAGGEQYIHSLWFEKRLMNCNHKNKNAARKSYQECLESQKCLTGDPSECPSPKCVQDV
jgi:hypothetical protein